VRYFQATHGIGSAARADELIGRLGYASCRSQRAGALSGGTRQTLSLTLALMHDPPVLLLDEPYQGFDWETYLAFWDLTGELRAAGTEFRLRATGAGIVVDGHDAHHRRAQRDHPHHRVCRIRRGTPVAAL
jgi:ABC-type Mn2+/Zn2+ transport system ATPase subunit